MLIEEGPDVPLIDMCPCSCADQAAEAKKSRERRKAKKESSAKKSAKSDAYEL